MTTFEGAVDVTATIPRVEDKPIRRTRALRLTVLPSFHTIVQLSCAAVGLGGVYLHFGTAVTMMVGAVAGAVVSMLREGGKI